MVKRKLVEELISDGARLLSELDHESFPVESMFWVHLPVEDYWRLVIASTFVAQHGSAAGYRRLNELQLLRDPELAGITLEDISLLDPASPQFQSFYSLACGSARLAPGPAWLEFEDAIVYRWTGASLSAELGCEVSAKELQKFWEFERLPFSHPALLISKEAGRVTLRIHPQHGPQERVDDSIKTSFAIALHRPNARPGCNVNWLN
jgi:hypothetical protein